MASGLPKGEGTNGGGGDWLREVELLRLVLRLSRGTQEAADEEADEGGREAEAAAATAAEVLEQAEPGLLGAGFRLGLGRVPPVGEATPTVARSSPALSSAVGLLAPQVWLRTEVAVEHSVRDVSEIWVMVSLPPPPAPPLFLEPADRSSRPMEPCLEALGVTLHACDCCPLVCEWTLVIDKETPLPPSVGLHTCRGKARGQQ